MERVVIVAYKPKPGKAEELKALVRNHHQVLDEQQLVTSRKPIIGEAADGTIVEIFGWKSPEAMSQAHQNKRVLQLWEEFAKVCDYVPINSVKESSSLFSEFKALNQ